MDNVCLFCGRWWCWRWTATTQEHLKNIRLRLYVKYRKHARLEMHTKYAKQNTNGSHEVLPNDGTWFHRPTSGNCCCGQCVAGWEHLQLLIDFIEDSTIRFTDSKAKVAKVKEIRRFLEHDYRWKHLQDSSTISTHCCNFALASPQACFTSNCVRSWPCTFKHVH